jgi:hypothetical protein
MSRTPTNAQSAMYEYRWKDCREKLKVALQERDMARARVKVLEEALLLLALGSLKSEEALAALQEQSK